MTDENRILEEKHECFCKSKGFRKFMTIAGGTFVGAFLALSLFSALHKPPMPAPMPCPCAYHQMTMRPHHPHHFDRGVNRWDKGPRGEFRKMKDFKRFEDKKFETRNDKIETPEVDD